MTGITFLKAQILSRSSKKWFDITPVAGYFFHTWTISPMYM